MVYRIVEDALLGLAAIPFVYYLLVLYSSYRYFDRQPAGGRPGAAFTPPVSNLKPTMGLDPDAYENFASFCRQDYPDYEILFCVGHPDDPVLPVIERLRRDFPDRSIRVIFHHGSGGSNDKVAKLARLVAEAKNQVLVISDSDVRVRPDYLRTVVAPLADDRVGAVTCFYVAAGEKTFAERLQTVGMISDFYAGILVARQLDGVKFALGPTIATRRDRLEGFGGYSALRDRPGDDLLVGRLIAEQGYQVELLPYTILTVPDYGSMRDLWAKRLRWFVVMRHMRPWGHMGLIFTQGLPWCLVAVAIRPTLGTALGYLGSYFALRAWMTWKIGAAGLQEQGVWRKMALIPIWDAMAFGLWMTSFLRSRVRWRNAEYSIREGKLVPVVPPAANESAGVAAKSGRSTVA
ncbi:MAG TPA: glycosyltransferase [Candidatus Dormibacteraeota bacterium]|nr:glycosyltransferase [Candidatus Dormibacteraeota bacterium]